MPPPTQQTRRQATTIVATCRRPRWSLLTAGTFQWLIGWCGKELTGLKAVRITHHPAPNSLLTLIQHGPDAVLLFLAELAEAPSRRVLIGLVDLADTLQLLVVLLAV